jgi:predicted naringenin-chalcone synthase
MNLCSLLTRRSATIASILTTAILSSGCAALLIGGAAAGGAVAYSRGELNSVESASLERTYAATRAAVKELQFVETEAKSDSVEAVVEARTALDRPRDVVFLCTAWCNHWLYRTTLWLRAGRI